MKIHSRKAYTLAEVMIATTVATVLMGGVMAFYLHTLKVGYSSQQQVVLQSTLRSITNEMLVNASKAHTCVLYNSAVATDRDEISDRREFDYSDTGTPINPTGNLLVFVHFQVPKEAKFPRHPITRLVGYFAEVVDADAPQINRITIELDEPSNDSIEQLLTKYWDGTATGAVVSRKTFAPRVIPLARTNTDPASPTTPQLFYKNTHETIAMCGQLLASAAKKNTKDRRTLTRTFFFAVSVRS